jgi:hypothetical protein
MYKSTGQGAGLYDATTANLNLVNPFISNAVTGFPTSNSKQRGEVRLTHPLTVTL